MDFKNITGIDLGMDQPVMCIRNRTKTGEILWRKPFILTLNTSTEDKDLLKVNVVGSNESFTNEINTVYFGDVIEIRLQDFDRNQYSDVIFTLKSSKFDKNIDLFEELDDSGITTYIINDDIEISLILR